jgi:hypothetical protein
MTTDICASDFIVTWGQLPLCWRDARLGNYVIAEYPPREPEEFRTGAYPRSLPQAGTYMILHVKWPLSSWDFNHNCYVSTDFRKNHQYNISLQTFQRFPSCYTWTGGWTDGQTDTVKPKRAGFENWNFVWWGITMTYLLCSSFNIWGSDGSDVDWGLLGCDAVLLFRRLRVFRTNVSPPSSATLSTGIIHPFEIMVTTYKTTRRHKPKDHNRHTFFFIWICYNLNNIKVRLRKLVTMLEFNSKCLIAAPSLY